MFVLYTHISKCSFRGQSWNPNRNTDTLSRRHSVEKSYNYLAKIDLKEKNYLVELVKRIVFRENDFENWKSFQNEDFLLSIFLRKELERRPSWQKIVSGTKTTKIYCSLCGILLL